MPHSAHPDPLYGGKGKIDMPERRLLRKDEYAKPETEAARSLAQGEEFIHEENWRGAQPDSIGPRLITPSQVMHLQRTIGNAAVQRFLAGKTSSVARGPEGSQVSEESADKASVLTRADRGGLVQRRLWSNVPAKFQTENDLAAPNSEYQVTSTGYRRYAPVNILRGIPDQVYYNKPDRSFVYLTGMPVVEDMNIPEFDALYEGPVESVVGGSVTFRSDVNPDSPPVVADIGPSEGAVVFDADIDDNGQVTDPHVGHTVKSLGQALNTLDDPDELLEVHRKLENGEFAALTQQESDDAVKEAKQKKAIKNSPYI
jgi:hypothetical protein